MDRPLYLDDSLSVEDRVTDLLDRMTLLEKTGQLAQYFYLGGGELPDDFDIESLPPEHRAYLDQPRAVEAAVSAGAAGSVLFVTDPALANRLQHRAVDETRLGIPLLMGFDVVHGLRTAFPVPIAMAASWSPELVESAQVIAAKEARAVGIHWTFAPMVDIARDPRWGRIIEGSGEDPVLGAAIAAAQVRGFQGEFGRESVLAGPKHFIGYGAARGGRDYDDAEVSEADLRNVYLPPFRAAIEAGAGNVMSAYMDLNGVPASANRRILRDLLRDELGFAGFTVSDANAVRSLLTQRFARDMTDAAARALTAGLDMEMCTVNPAYAELPAAVAAGTVTEETIDAAVRRVLTAKFRLGLFEHPFVDESAAGSVLAATEHRNAARAAAERTFVLLRNEEQVLPLDAQNLGSIAVIGQLAASQRDTLGPWMFDHDTTETVTILDGIRTRVGAGSEVVWAAGAGIPERVFPSMFDRMDSTIERTADDHDDASATAEAVAAAAGADVAIVVVGQRQNQIGEKSSTDTLDLPGRQLEQLQRIVATGTPTVLLVMSGRPLDLRWAAENVPAIMQVWYPGTRGGDAVAATLFGDVSPAGRLPFTWPRHVGQVPMVYSHQRTFEPDEQGSRYFLEESTPLFPFGYGLSYSGFEYEDLHVDREQLRLGHQATVSVTVRNTGDRAADDVVQLYVHQRYGKSSRPVRQLQGFQRVTLEAGEQHTLTFPLGPEQLRYWSDETRDVVQDATLLDLWVGGSADAALTTSLEVVE
ncbi:beta-glucosidase [Curtobacterium sp. MCPF17_018]|uniref:glycoside hydrolase family 3 N-terminal domain-containing protein n=1 Tax=Curtobacterium sp. MCPF17_018 TaxID=2175638 RepID=UPI000DAA7ABC|nr:glycoside hydrolase family 3 N-terminal domain-containing protein [Curtobacterium sp. MCPF17_018]PZE67378.1 beta-glucosidase [Curtobacterium sp. MCPF17_018]